MPGCIIRCCPSRRSQQPEAVLHAFPRSAQRIRIWLERTGHHFKDMDAFITRILEAKKSDGYGICSAHFTADCYVSSGEGRALRPEAVPTIFPPGDKLISEVVQLRVSRKARQARLQNASRPADSASGLAGASSIYLTAMAAKMDAATQTEEGPADPSKEPHRGAHIKGEPGHRLHSSVTVKYENDPPDAQRSDKNHQSRISDRILQLTLQIIFLLTGEDYGPIKKESGDYVTRSLIIGPERTNQQKILEVTNNIIELLTGEVPVRCHEVTTDEQEHKDHYNEDLMEDQPLHRSQDVAGKSVRSLKTFPMLDKNKGRLTSKSRSTPSTHNNEPSGSPSEKHLPLPDGTRWKCPSSHIMEEHLPKPNASIHTHSPQYPTPIQEQHGSSEEEHLPYSAISIPHTGHLSAPSKERSTSGEQRLPNPDLSTPTQHRRKRSPPIKEEPSLCEEEHSEDELDFRTIVEEDDSMSCEEEHFPNPDLATSSGEERHPRFSEHSIPSGQLQRDVPDMPTNDGEPEPLLSEDGLYTDTSAPVDYSATGIHKTFLDHPEYFDRSLFCPECGKSFTDKARVEAHLLTHWGNKAYRCSMCPRTFRSQTRFIVHQMMHSGEKPYSCSECGKRFAQNSYLQRHMMGHTGERPFPCSICGKGFTCKSDLVKHERTHTGARPHPCLVCNKRFTKKSHLNRHMRIHTGEKPFCCPDCGRSFGCNSDMVSHQRIHQGIKPFSCTECGKGFLRKQDAIRHQTIHRM